MDGYYARSETGRTDGPMSEADFDRLRRTPAGKRLVSAYRLAGGHAYQISVRRRIAFDRRHALSGRACAVCVEIGVIVFCLLVVGLMVLLVESEPMRKERESAGVALTGFVAILIVATCALAAIALRRMVRRWRAASSTIFTSEV
mmetsp:Transcript_12282/g.40749  ORF Transcript_12282/g.40749 Transcript_12282/m.40749 type:complete len:145 (+) Transcript_12282:45-479(+)